MSEEDRPYLIVTVRMPGRVLLELGPDPMAIPTWFGQHGIQFAGQDTPAPPWRVWQDLATNELVVEQRRYDNPE